MKIAQLVIGPAGAGKSTYTRTLLSHLASATAGRSAHWVNLDPAAEVPSAQDPAANSDAVPPCIDIQNLVSLEEVMQHMHLGPNGALIHALELLLENSHWLIDSLGDYQDDYLIIDAPGQIEIYTHTDIMSRFVQLFQTQGYTVVVVYLLDSAFMADRAKFIAGVLSAVGAMVQLQVPHINVISKMDLLQQRKKEDGGEYDEEEDFDQHEQAYGKYFDVDVTDILAFSEPGMNPSKFTALDSAMAQLIQEYNMVSFIPLNITRESSITYLLSHIDHAVQYGEDLEPREPKELGMGEPDVEEAFA
ncbi:MAG: hypothetical protein SGCHY_001310 [Lobulomycetales sp.]